MWTVSLDLERGGGFLSCLLGDELCVCKSAAKPGKNIWVRENTAWKGNGIPLHRSLREVSANLVYPIFCQAKSFNQLFSASFLFTGAAHTNSYQLIISVLLDKVLFGVTKAKGNKAWAVCFTSTATAGVLPHNRSLGTLNLFCLLNRTWAELLFTWKITTTTTTTQPKCF